MGNITEDIEKELKVKDIIIRKRTGITTGYDPSKIRTALRQCMKRCHVRYRTEILEQIDAEIRHTVAAQMSVSSIFPTPENFRTITVEQVQDIVEHVLMEHHPEVAKEYILYRHHKEQIRDWVDTKEEFIRKYKDASNTADATIDDNSNVSNKNIGILNNEIHKEDNIQVNRRMVVRKLRELYPDFDAKQYERDLASHIIYKHDESSFSLPAPYCVALTMYPFLADGIKGIGGLSAKPKNLDSYCGMLVNMIFAVSAQFLGAVACPEALLYFDYFARKEWGDDYYLHVDDVVNPRSTHPRTIGEQIHQHFQQMIYSINQPAAARGLQSAFVNFSYYDKAFFDSMFGDFYFPDGTQPVWGSLNWLQKDFMQWFNQERMRCILTFPVESFALVYKDHQFADPENAEFVAEEYARGHSFFTYISDTVDSLSSCCFEGSEQIEISENDRRYITSIGDFVNKLDGNINKHGSPISKDIKIISFTNTGKTIETKVTGTLKKEYSGKMYKISAGENTIDVTEDHLILVKDLSDNQVKQVAVCEVYRDKDRYLIAVDD